MLLAWTELFNNLNRHSRANAKDPLADPLEGREWNGFLWFIDLLAWLRRIRKPGPLPQKSNPTEHASRCDHGRPPAANARS